MSTSQNPSLPASPELPESVRQAIRSCVERHLAPWANYADKTDEAAQGFIAALTPLWPSADGKEETGVFKYVPLEKPINMQHGDTLLQLENGSYGVQRKDGSFEVYERSAPTPSPVAGLPTPETDVHEFVDYLKSLTKPEGSAWTGADIEHAFNAGRGNLAAARAEVERLQAWKQYAEGHGLHIALNKTSDCPEGRLAHTYREGSTLHRMFDEWSDSIGWKAQLATAKEENAEIAAQLSEWMKTAQRRAEELAKANAAVEEHQNAAASAIADNIILRAQLAAQQSVPVAPESEPASCKDADGCPQEMAVLKRFWREHQSVPPEARAVEAENILTAQLALPPDKRDWNEVHRAALSLRTVVPPGEGEEWAKCAEYGWTVIANASGGNWNHQSQDWQDAAAKFREMYHACLGSAPSRPTAAREDTARLDWLAVDPHKRLPAVETSMSHIHATNPGIDPLRHAIDAAMQQGGKTP